MLGAVDYLGTGPVFTTATKSDAGGAIGIAGLRAMVARGHLPIVAIGGIGLTNADEVMASGVDGIAVVSAVMAAADPTAAARSLRTIVDTNLKHRSPKP
jgi:thiamine-phosphate pyrophosphorylase